MASGWASAAVHKTAIVDPGAELGEGVSVGPYSIIGSKVQLEAGVQIGANVHVTGRTRLGPRVRVFPGAVVGEIPQDLKYAGEDSQLEIGEDTVVREHVTVHIGTDGGGGLTRVGSRCLIMIGSHVAHDCMIGDNVIVGQAAALAGHVQLGDHVVLGGCCGVHQHCRIGRHAMVGGMSGVFADLLPFCLCTGSRACLTGINLRGLRRRGFSRAVIASLGEAYAVLFSGEGTLAGRAQELLESPGAPAEVQELARFILERSDRPMMHPESELPRGG